MAVIYGRRRVGKTSLIKQLLSNKLAIYVQGVQATAETNLRFLSNAILDFEEPKRINRHKTFFDLQNHQLKLVQFCSTQSIIFIKRKIILC